MSAGNGTGRILLRDHLEPKGPQVDAQGRNLNRAPDLRTVYDLIAQETAKVHEYYLNQIPPFVANMIMDGLVSHGLIKDPRPVAQTDDVETPSQTPRETPEIEGKVISIPPDSPPSDGDEKPVVNPS